MAPTPIQSRVLGIMWRLTSTLTNGRGTTFTTFPITCSRWGAGQRVWTNSQNSFILSLQRTGDNVPPCPSRIKHRVRSSWSVDIFNCIPHQRYMRMRTAAANHLWLGYFRCVFRNNKTQWIYLGHGWLAAPAAIFGHTPVVVPMKHSNV